MIRAAVRTPSEVRKNDQVNQDCPDYLAQKKKKKQGVS